MDSEIGDPPAVAILSPYLSNKSNITPFVQPKPVWNTLYLNGITHIM